MSLGTLWVGISTFVTGGVLGSLATVYATRKESQDRRDALALEREKFEHERDTDVRARQRAALESAKEALSGMTDFMYQAFNYDLSRLEAIVGDVHESRVHYGAILTAARHLDDFGMKDEANLIEHVAAAFSTAIRDWTTENYRAWVETNISAGNALDARFARIP